MPIPHITSRHFVRDLLLVFLLLSAVVIGSVTFFSIRAREDISQKFIDNAASGAVRQFASMAASMNQTLALTGDWIGSGKASLDKPSMCPKTDTTADSPRRASGG